MARKRSAEEEENHLDATMGEGSLNGDAAAGDDVDVAERGGAAGDQVAQLEAEVAEWKDRTLRAVADMENVRRRARIDAEEARKFASEGLLSDLLPVLDNFGRALEAAEQTSDFEALKSGVDLTRRQLLDVLNRNGLRQIEALGQPFDPNLHEAIMQAEPQEGQQPGQVVEELRPGYRLNDRVIRPSLVKVTSG
jgi:molecular chaperone GrpE